MLIIAISHGRRSDAFICSSSVTPQELNNYLNFDLVTDHVCKTHNLTKAMIDEILVIEADAIQVHFYTEDGLGDNASE
jgi:hypothetical protein